ncbi:hypothetical protein CD148_05815 [Staphylococcus delphini]|uniref:Uncharacterized protein n=2 Tax=Staphylococcus delphini TaxID=53344 RepID=A0AAX0QVI6_9STAP|nr:hypothetical protein B5C07_04555 [Staphylococcus delphini]PNZ95087.1 hypothetical protein CD148_05815 [Staphylococcus delphini]RIZ52705.1 hypothetical protein CDL68_08440 [Staphylococcus delphini]
MKCESFMKVQPFISNNANLSPGGFIYDLTVIQAGDIKDSWIKAAAAGKSAQIDHCQATNPGHTNGNGVLAYENVKFK